MALLQPDTNIVVHFVRNDAVFRLIDARFDLASGKDQFVISVVVEAEIRALAQELSWVTAKRKRMENFIALCTVVPISYASIVDSYVEVSDFSRRAGRAMGKNDIGIAAATIVTGATLLTTDKDFDHLDPALLARFCIDPSI